MDTIHDKFIEEAKELLLDLEKALLELEQTPQDTKLIEQAFRAMHTLKGTSSMFGFVKVGNLTHDLETVYEFIRNGKTTFTPEIQHVTFSSVDLIHELLATNDELAAEDSPERYKNLIEEIKKLAGTLEDNIPAADQSSAVKIHEKTAQTYFISFRPKETLFSRGANPLYLIDDLYALGKCLVFPHFENIPALNLLEEHNCYLYWKALLVTTQDISAIKEIFIFVEDLCTLEVHAVAEGDLLASGDFTKAIDDIFKNKSPITLGAVTDSIRGEKTNAKGSDKTKKKVVVAKDNSISSIRVPSDKLDGVINIVSELITLQARLTLIAEKNSDPSLVTVTEDFEKLLRQLRDTSLGMCLIPVETLYTRFQRLVRDLSKDLHKDIKLITEGGDTELDKSIIENLSDPILHLLRNSIDHGIEDTATRVAKGKSKQGFVRLKSFYATGSVIITIQDDGKGMDSAKIKAKAVEKGLIQPDAILSDKEGLNLIFLPGFSTAEKVTEVSGRGVGMDVVRQKVEELRGEIDIESAVDKGTTITVRLPLSLSIIDGLLIKIGDTSFVLPLALVHKCYEINHEKLASAYSDLLIIEGEQIPYVNLRDEFALSGEAPAIEQAITMEYEGQKVAFIVDSIVGEYQAVLKPITNLYKGHGHDIVFGATIMGDGSIALVLDTNRIVKQHSNKILIKHY